MLKTLRYLDGKQRWQCLVVLAFVVVQVWLDLTLPDYMANITTLAETAGSSLYAILWQGLMMVLCALSSMVATVAATYYGNKVAAGLAATLRQEVFDHALDLSKADVDQMGAASLVNRCTNDITQIQTLVSMGLSAIIKAPIMVVWAVVKIMGYGWQWTCATVVAAITLCIVLGVTMSIAVPRYQRIQGLTDGSGLTLFSQMIVFSNYAIQIIMSFMLLSMVFILYPRAQVSAGRVMEVIERTPQIQDGPGVETTDEKGTVEFRNVSFSYPDDGARALDGVSFRAEPGQTVAFIGATGSGKTTLVQLVDRLFDATSGQVLVDGHDVREYTSTQLHQRIGYVPQTTTLFAGTVASNVSYGNAGHEVTHDEFMRSCPTYQKIVSSQLSKEEIAHA
ncbi:ABC transporter ATP-binding protein [Olsenella sp. Marseille-P4559]|uniref:ATP-binding cassette domain-containing protein n=1 Tax=Olsenella sp. Marseille-P4559 TaxID=2364795 RepID=UPI001030A793|nr:ABC transporter ATP-binding protein [Olsenella sp. Marseille-P4559]